MAVSKLVRNSFRAAAHSGFNSTRSNEESELEKRYLKFNLKQLLDVANGVCNGAQYCSCSDSVENSEIELQLTSFKAPELQSAWKACIIKSFS